MESIGAHVIIVGGGIAGLSAAIYLGRAKRETLLIDSGKSMARWEPDVQNYLGFPEGIAGTELLRRARAQARRYGVKILRDEVVGAERSRKGFCLEGRKVRYFAPRVLLSTGIFHLPPTIPGVDACLGHSFFFCKDCDGYRIQGRPIAIYGWSNDTVQYALGMLFYSPCVAVVTDGHPPRWDAQHANWLREYEIPVHQTKIVDVARQGSRLHGLKFDDGSELVIEALFTTRGDVYLNQLARALRAKIDREGDIVVDADMRTTVPGLYAAGCVTPANCQMIIAAGQGAAAAQAINRDLFLESLATHSLRRFRGRQLTREKTHPTRHRRPPFGR